MKKIDINSDLFSIYGLPWYEENENKLWRLPIKIKDEVSQAVWNLSLSPSGARIRFKSDTSLLGLNAFYDLGDHMNNMCRIGQAGCDVYVDGEFWACVFPTNTGSFEEFFFENVDSKMRNYEIYLPPYHSIDLRKIIVDDDATIEPADSYKLREPLVFYGTSITQGGCSSRAGLTYQAQLSRALNLDFVNLGFSGNGRGDLAIAKLMGEIDASCYILDYGQNNISIGEMQKVYLPFIDKIREKKPKTPIVLTTPLFSTLERWDKDFSLVQKERRKIVKETYKILMKKGVKNIFLLEWDKSIDMEDGEGYVDGLHPNDLGFYKMSQGMKVILEEILNI